MGFTLFEKIWDQHRILTSPDGLDLLHIDRSLLTDLSGMIGLEELDAEGLCVANPELQFAVPDHVIPSTDRNDPVNRKRYDRFVGNLATLAKRADIRHFPRGSGWQGIVHIVGLERAITLPGLIVVCGDSHTSTHGAVGALGLGIGSTEVKHVLATQTLWQKKPKQARIWIEGRLSPGVYAKDLILYLIGELGADYGREHAVEFAGPVIANLSIEGRATICNLATELGARVGIIAPDETTFSYIKGRNFAPTTDDWQQTVVAWRGLRSDDEAVFDKQDHINADNIQPQITWGVSPEQVARIGGQIPPASSIDSTVINYIGLQPEQDIQGVPIDYVFIGSCANGRIEDLRIAAQIVKNRKIAEGVIGLIVPGSEAVKHQAECEGLDIIFRNAGFEWRQPGCSMCVAVNGDLVPPGKRCVSTTNRNFIGRQGPAARTHLASPATAAASAIAGKIVDPRDYLKPESEMA